MSGQAAKPQLIYVLWGSDRFTRDEQVRGLKRRMLAEPFGEYNLSVLSGEDVAVRDVKAVADALPFMGDRRLIVVEGLLGRIAGSGKSGARRGRGGRASTASTRASARKSVEKAPAASPTAELETMLRDLPDSTALVLVEDQIDPSLVESWLPPDRAHI